LATATRELLTVAETADQARVSERTIWRWLNDGLPRLQPSGRHGAVRIDPKGLWAFLHQDPPDSRQRLLTEIRAEAERVRRARSPLAA
jgi:hypothetical protein